MRRAALSVTSAVASFAIVVGAGGGLRSLHALAADVFGSSAAAHTASSSTKAHRAVATYAPVAPTTVDGATINYGYGELQTAVTFARHRLESIQVIHFVAADSYSAALEQAAVGILDHEVLAAQGLPIEVVTGATYTSEAYATSVQAALDRERART
ncbi:FMN-binding domain protein [Acidimicrobium ferrooxidans DSM 10331]|uniref:FMN-binding domain protein n=1 Tax=Acidimicrobium ferrooxidans (strain DSM 10331 / JCM 15462 / NBRC 103882 / ICP) TaxID=525909 RepID=C7LZS2_ACIFD|nr:FMN-binding protein [Acidimicrobium ferrooxidans]ACU54230.1 FMN-binding domain protein [Acidimicrobium ferrooxidans DSM 10331]